MSMKMKKGITMVFEDLIAMKECSQIKKFTIS
jgi:hypothetical protein